MHVVSRVNVCVLLFVCFSFALLWAQPQPHSPPVHVDRVQRRRCITYMQAANFYRRNYYYYFMRTCCMWRWNCVQCTRRWRESSIRQTPCPDNFVGSNHLIAVFIALTVCSCVYAQAAHCISQHSHVHYVDCGFIFFFLLLIYVQLASVTALPPRCVCCFFYTQLRWSIKMMLLLAFGVALLPLPFHSFSSFLSQLLFARLFHSSSVFCWLFFFFTFSYFSFLFFAFAFLFVWTFWYFDFACATLSNILIIWIRVEWFSMRARVCSSSQFNEPNAHTGLRSSSSLSSTLVHINAAYVYHYCYYYYYY